MSTPVSIHDGPFTTNTLTSKNFLVLYISIIWGSILPLLLEFYLFLNLIQYDPFLFILLLPFQFYVGYIILVSFSIIIAKIFLLIINFIHKPKEGVFERKKTDRDYYFWSLRAVIKKWPIWISKFIPLPLVDKLNVRWFDNDSEFIEYEKNVCIGKGSSIKASMIFREFLIIKKIKIENEVTIGSNSYITPGTHVCKNTTIAAMSVTKFNEKIKNNSILNNYPNDSIQGINDILSNIVNNQCENQQIEKLSSDKPQAEKFVKSLNFNLFVFGIIYFFSNIIPILGSIYFVKQFLFPYFLLSPNFFAIFKNINSLVIFLITPLIFIIIYIINLLMVIFFTKFIYKFIQILNPIKEGVLHWENKNNQYKYYFKRSFILRYVKWKIQKSPFPWLIKFAFNCIGNCSIGKNTVIEDSFLAKELLKIGENTYLGKILLANHLWDRNLTIKKIVIGDNVTVLDNCCIAPGTEIKENVSLLPLSVTTKNDKLSADSIYYNVPLTKISNEGLINAFNLDIHDLTLKKLYKCLIKHKVDFNYKHRSFDNN